MQDVIKRVSTTLSIRGERIASAFTPVMPSFGAEWKPLKHLRIFGNAARSYRVPTFNERYWITGVSSANLEPESGWGEELSAAVNGSFKQTAFDLTFTGFNRNIRNWIMWLPAGMEWAPRNLKQVWSRGLEAEANVKITAGKWKLNYHATVNYVLSTNKATALANDASLGRQLIYVPRITQQHQVTASLQTFYIGYLHSYTGLRFTSTDNTQWLNDYSLGSVVAGKEFRWKGYALVLTAQVNNLFDLSYQAVADRPMPGRNFLTTITLKL
jgi:iron complex outermembrane receptor protein